MKQDDKMTPYQLAELTAVNWGPIREARLKLGELTILIGPQNSGKTYLALLTSMLKELLESHVLTHLVTNNVVRAMKDDGISGYVSTEQVVTFTKNNAEQIIEYIIEEAKLSLPKIVEWLVNEYYSINIGELIGSEKNEAIFGMMIKGISDKPVSLEITASRYKPPEISLNISPETISYWVSIISPVITIHEGGWSATYRHKLPLRMSTLYIPAERLILFPMLAEVVTLVMNILREFEKLRGERIFRIRRPIFEYINLLNLVIKGAPAQKYKILGYGEVEVSQAGISYHDSKRNVVVPLNASGSGVMQLAGIVLPLEHVKSNFIVVEEPEINLHADAQLKVAEYLTSFTSTSQLFITTHSHYLLAKFANLYARGHIRDFRAHYIDIETGKTLELEVFRETGEVELPESIKKAIESLAKESIELSERFYDTTA